MSANPTQPLPEPGDSIPAKLAEKTESSVSAEPAWTESSLPLNLQQPLREYTSFGTGSPPYWPWSPPATPPINTGASAQQPFGAGYPGHSEQFWATGAPPFPMAPVYPGYGYYGPIPVPQVRQRGRGAYALTVAIAAFACSCLVLLGGLVSLALMGLASILEPSSLDINSTNFAGLVILLALAIVGIGGGSFSLYHSIRSLFLRKPSRAIWLPRFWIFVLCYLLLLGLSYWLNMPGMAALPTAVTILLIYLGALLPALAILALGIRRLRPTKAGPWPTTWRRFVLALISGATLSTLLASLLELLLGFILFGAQSQTLLQSLNSGNINSPDPSFYGMLMLLLAVIAPLVEEIVKPLAVIILIGRLQNKAEAFALGLACGIGFNLLETTGYISSGDSSWLNVELLRSATGLLHGFGAAMVALGWYYLTHKEEGTRLRRILLASGCGFYAVLQHALWNGSWGLELLPGAVGSFFQTWSLNIGSLSIDTPDLANLLEIIGILIFFVFMSGHLRPSLNKFSHTITRSKKRNSYLLLSL